MRWGGEVGRGGGRVNKQWKLVSIAVKLGLVPGTGSFTMYTQEVPPLHTHTHIHTHMMTHSPCRT